LSAGSQRKKERAIHWNGYYLAGCRKTIFDLWLRLQVNFP
jgi:hypothetical protein